jgi:hypothetical protein
MRRTKRHKSPRTRRSHAKRNHIKPKAARKPKVCEKCGVKRGDPHDKDAHYNAMLRRMGISIQEGAE